LLPFLEKQGQGGAAAERLVVGVGEDGKESSVSH
jgi:hypothetical protein